MAKCLHDPRGVTGPIGMYHCPVCGNMVVAGCVHPDWDSLEDPLMGIDSFMFPRAGINTVRASWWTIRLAKIFGKRVEGTDSAYRVVAYRWRGNLYFTEFHQTLTSKGSSDE
jgi:hypothetical protein